MISNEATHKDSTKKLEPKNIGPYTIVKVNKHDCIVESADKKYRKAIHLSRIHRYLPPKVGEESSNSKIAASVLPNSPISPDSNISKPMETSSSVQPSTNYTTRYGRVTKRVRFK